MKGRCSDIFSFLVVLCATLIIVPITIECVPSAHTGKEVLSEHLHIKGSLKIEDKVSSRKGHSDEEKNSLFVKSSADISTKLELLPLQLFRNNSCDVSNDQQGLYGIVINEMFCEMKNLFYYAMVSFQNLKTELRIDLIHLVFKIPYYVIQLKEHAFTGVIIDSVKSHIAKLEVFLKDATNVQILIDIVKKSVPIFDIVETLSRLKIIVQKFFIEIGNLFTDFEDYINMAKEIVKDLEFHISVILENISNFLYEYLSARVEETKNTILKIILWMTEMLNNLKTRVGERFHWFLAITKEVFDVFHAFRKGYYAFGISQAVIDAIFIFCDSCKPPLTYNISSTCNITPSPTQCPCSESFTDYSEDDYPSFDENTTPLSSEPIYTHLPIPMHNLEELDKHSLDPIESNNSNPSDSEHLSSSEDENSKVSDSSVASTMGNEHSENVTPFYRLLRSFPQNENPMGALSSNTGKDSIVSTKHTSSITSLNSYRCGTSTFLPSFSSLNNVLKDASVKQTSLVISKKEISSALGNESLSSDDIIVIFLDNDRGLIGLVKDSLNQIDFKVYKLKSFFTNAQSNNIKIWHLRSGDFHNPSCEHKFQLLFQN
ncbi:hypothetical protein ANTPLA_LOCUS10365 [Anthophora plagiata]